MPTTKPFTVVLGLLLFVKLTADGAPAATDQVPVPLTGVFADRMVDVVKQTCVSVPALAGVTAGKTVMVMELEYCGLQTPLCTEALYCVVVFKLLKLRVLLVLLIVVQLAPLSIEDSQSNILPVYPVSVSVPLFAVAQTVLLADKVPGTVAG